MRFACARNLMRDTPTPPFEETKISAPIDTQVAYSRRGATRKNITMCVILVCPQDIRPSGQILNACQKANPHGAGVGWRQRGRVHWMKNLSADEVGELLPQLTGEIVIHFRWASVGGVNPRLCHPFPVDGGAETKLSGTTKTLLFHNGTWKSHASALEYLEREQERKIVGPISDSRVLALLVAHARNPDILDQIEGRFVVFGHKETRVYGSWQEWAGMRCSNLAFRYEMEREDHRVRWGIGRRKSLHDQVSLDLWEGRQS